MVECDIVIIDSGLSLSYQLQIPGIQIVSNVKCCEILEGYADIIGHGTIVYSIIKKQVEGASIFIIKLPDDEESRDLSCLITALEYIKNNVRCKIVNISLGVNISDNVADLYDICAEIASIGVVIVAAFDNNGSNSYPAAFDCVIGVDSSKYVKNISEFVFVENSPVNILAKGNLQRITIQDQVFLVSGSSIACAHITSIIANAMTENLNFDKALEYLRLKSKKIYHSYAMMSNDNSLFKVTNAAVFPFSKEAQAFLRFEDKLNFNIHGFFDVRFSGKVGKKLTDYYICAPKSKFIMDIEKIDFEKIDTIILGHLDELNLILERDYRLELIKKAISMNVNIYSFDPLDSYIDLLKDSNINFFYPYISKSHITQHSFGKLYKISRPVVGVFGTSSKQGKFSLQMALKNELESRGYDVGTIGTEPHSLLFGFDAVFPMGYNSTVDLRANEIVLYLNTTINNLCLQGKEIILVSTQAQIIPYYCNNLLEYPTMQYHFALGTHPDVIVMCINYHDEVSYIRNSIYALMGLTDATIIALVMFPIKLTSVDNNLFGNFRSEISHEEFEHKKRLLEEEFKVPVFLLGNHQHVCDLCERIIDYF